MRAGLAGILTLVAGAVVAQEITAPSGLVLGVAEVVLERETGMARLRFVAEGLAGAEFDAVAADMQWLCDTHGAPALAQNGIAPVQIVISVADREVPFGVMDPEAVQYFEGYSVAGDGTCHWEPY